MCVYFAVGEVSDTGDKEKVESIAHTHGEGYARSHTLQHYHETHLPGGGFTAQTHKPPGPRTEHDSKICFYCNSESRLTVSCLSLGIKTDQQ